MADYQDDVITLEQLAVLRGQTDRRALTKLRRDKRYAWYATLHLTIDERRTGGREEQVEVQTADLSCSGFAFVFGRFVRPGTQVTAELPLPGKPTAMGTVQYCRHIRGREHRVGVELTTLRESLPRR